MSVPARHALRTSPALACERVDEAAREPFLPTWLVVWTVCFCAILPFPGSKVLWAATVALCAWTALTRRHLVRGVSLSIVLVAQMAWLGLSVLWSVVPGTTASAVVIQVLQVGLGMLVAVGRPLAQLVRLFATTAAWFLAVNVAVGLLLPGIGITSEGPYSNVMRGVFVDKNLFAYFAVVSFGAGFCLLLDAWQGGRVHAADLARPAIAVVAVLLAHSATGLALTVVTAVLAVVLTHLTRVRRPLLVPLGAWALVAGALVWLVAANWSAILLLLGRTPTLTGRTRIWYAVELAIAQRPWAGYGWKALWIDGDPTSVAIWADNYRVPFYHAHNGYLDTAAQLGVVGLVLTVLVWAVVVRHGWHHALRARTAVSVWPVLLVAILTLYNATEVVGFTNTTWVLLVALTCLLPQNRKERACTSATPGDSSSAPCP